MSTVYELNVFCRGVQTVELARHIRLVDSPGVVLASKDNLDPVEFALKNAVRVGARRTRFVDSHDTYIH